MANLGEEGESPKGRDGVMRPAEAHARHEQSKALHGAGGILFRDSEDERSEGL